jgi:hypothetical protein
VWIDLAWNAGVVGLDAPDGPGRARRSWVWHGSARSVVRSRANHATRKLGTCGERDIPLRQRVPRGLLLLQGRPRLRVRLGLRLRFGQPRPCVQRGPAVPRVRLRLTGHSGDVAASTGPCDVHPLSQLRQRPPAVTLARLDDGRIPHLRVPQAQQAAPGPCALAGPTHLRYAFEGRGGHAVDTVAIADAGAAGRDVHKAAGGFVSGGCPFQASFRLDDSPRIQRLQPRIGIDKLN